MAFLPLRPSACDVVVGRSPVRPSMVVADLASADELGASRLHVYRPNTYSIDAVDVFLSSGAFGMTAFGCREPTSTAMYCLPLTE